ncbi:hypothetical protein ACHRVY_18410 [Flavobacterium plurextorum]|uniref:hypothetical protein n=2 Tax=Flavobacterium plurextorum TaxID=1114867 RepID=UPI0037571722
MKKHLSILFLSVYLLSVTQLVELIKLPVMVEHYVEHKEQNPNLTFFQFLCIHYQGQDVYDADYEKDMKLPFKSHTNISSVVFYPLLQEYKTIQKVNYKYKKQNLYTYSFSYSSISLSSIWQPPRDC